MSDCASICKILISHWTLRSFEMKNGGLGQRRKRASFSSALPQGGLRNANHSGFSIVGAEAP